MAEVNVSINAGCVESDGLGLTEGLGEGEACGPPTWLEAGRNTRQADRSDHDNDNGRNRHLRETIGGRELPRQADDDAPLWRGVDDLESLLEEPVGRPWRGLRLVEVREPTAQVLVRRHAERPSRPRSMDERSSAARAARSASIA